MRVLVVDNKRSAADQLRRAFEGEGYSVVLAYDGEQALAIGKSDELDVIVLDVTLPRLDGFTVIRRLREAKLRTPTIIFSARTSMSDIVLGLDSGADDYLVKPCALDVLLAHVRAAARRAPVTHPEDLRFQDVTLKPRTYELQRGARSVSLTRTEYALLEALMRRARAVVSKDVLMEEGWGMDADVTPASLYVFMRSLRSKLTQPGEPEILHTVRGVGYSLRSKAC
jgi:DNA-binding response OmpR family regulator